MRASIGSLGTRVMQWPLLTVACAMLVGLAVGSELRVETAGLMLGLIALTTLFGLGLSLVRMSRWLVVPLCLLVALIAASSTLVRAWFNPLVTSAVTITDQVATVVSSPVSRGASVRGYIVLDTGPRERLWAQWSVGEPVQYGDRLRLSGKLVPAERTPTFDEIRYVRAHGAVGRLEITAFDVLPETGGSPILRALDRGRLVILGRLQRLFVPPVNTLVAGVILGAQGPLAPTLEEAFRRTGTSHLLVASGSNLVIFAGILGALVAGLGRRRRIFIVSMFLALFVVLTGAESSILRAAIFVGLLFLAELTGRRVHSPTLIATAALGMALVNPWIVLGDIGFQLSFAAVLGLTLFGPMWTKLIPTWVGKEFLAPTLSAHLTTLPVLVYHFGSASLIAPVANLLAVPFALPIMLGGLASLALPWLRVVVWATAGATTLFLSVIVALSQLSWAAVILPQHHWLWTSASLGLVVAGLGLRRWALARAVSHE